MTPTEIISFSGVKINTPPCSFREIYTIEYYQARTCLGFDFWGDLTGALADYSSAAEWSQQEYSQDAIVLYQKVYYQASQITEAQPPTKPDWAVAPKFTGDCAATYDALFCDFLGPFLAKTVLFNRLPFIRNQVDGLGVLEYNGSEYETGEEEDYQRLKSAIKRDAAMAWGNFVHHMSQQAQKDNDCLANYMGYDDDDCTTKDKDCKPKKHRYGIYKFG